MIINKNFKEKACILPWVCFSIGSGNRGKVCCSSRLPICYIDENSDLDKIWNSEFFKEIREDFLNGRIPLTCVPCKNAELVNLRSRRLRFKEWMYDNIFDIEDNPKLQYLDINFSNMCNLNCVMCSSEFSSKWIEYDKQIIDKFKFRDHVKPFLKVERVPKSFIDQIKIKDLKVIEVKGGEPFIEPRFIYFIDRFLNESGTAFVHLTTNLTHFPDDLKEKLSKIQNLSVDVSVDGTGDVYKYIRGIDLEKVADNLYKLSDLDNIIKLRINITTTPYNLWNSCSVIDWVKGINSKIKVNWCPMSRSPNYVNPSILPYKMRVDAANKIEKFVKNVGKNYTLDIDSTIEYLKKENPERYNYAKMQYLRECFLKWTNKVNEWRSMNIYDIVPQLGDIKKQWTKN